MKQLLILGASGYGRDIYDMAQECVGYGEAFIIKGFLDPNIDALKEFTKYPPVIGNEDEYEIQPDDVFFCAIGNVNLKKKITEKMESRGAHFYTLIHKTAHVSPTCTIGEGSILEFNAYVGSCSIVGKHCFIKKCALVNHDVKMGDYCSIGNLVCLTGGTILGDLVTVNAAAVTNYHVTLGSHSVVGACSFVSHEVEEKATVVGIPAKPLIKKQ